MEKLTLEDATFPPDILLDLKMAGTVLSRHGANQIILYGSMAKGTYRPDSDIDICVAGLPSQNFFRAMAECLMTAHRPVSIVDLRNIHGYFRERVLEEGKVLMSIDILKQEIEFGLKNLDKIQANIATFSNLKIDAKVKVSALTYECLGYCNAIEHLIIRFLKYLNLAVPTGKFSHRDTLRQFEKTLSEAGLQATRGTIEVIENLMAFRHVTTKIYGFLIDAEKLAGVIDDVQSNHTAIKGLFRDLVDII